MKMKIKFLLALMIALPLLSFGQVADSIKMMPKYGDDSLKCLTNISLYRESFKQWKDAKYAKGGFDNSYKYWAWVRDNCPKSTIRLYTDGVTILSDKINSAKTEEEKQAYIDSVMMLYDMRITYFGDKGNVLARKGLDALRYRPKETKFIYDMLSESVNIEKGQSMDAALSALFNLSIRMYEEGLAEKSIIIEDYDRVMTLIEENIDKERNKTQFLSLRAQVENEFAPYASCEDIIPIYQKKFETTPNDTMLLAKIAYMLDKKGCTSSQLFTDVVMKYHELKPSPESASMLGKLMIKDNDYDKAITYLLESLQMEDDEKVYGSCMLLAHCYQVKGDYTESRNMALKATKYDSSKGEPYMFIGDLYAMSGNKCKSDDKISDKAVFWVAVDMYTKAKQVDATVAEEANKRIRDYSQYFPDAQTLFFSEIIVGDTYKLGCWINESTVVRAAK